MLESFTLLLVCQIVGEAVVRGAGLPLPGPVLGMLLLFVVMQLRLPLPAELPVVDLTVVVYKGRGLQLAPGTLDQTETLCRATGSQGGTTIHLSAPPPLRRGSWILDASTETTQQGLQQHGPVHAYLYRVTAVMQDSHSTILEVDSVLKADVTQIIVMDNVVEVFEKGPGRLP